MGIERVRAHLTPDERAFAIAAVQSIVGHSQSVSITGLPQAVQPDAPVLGFKPERPRASPQTPSAARYDDVR